MWKPMELFDFDGDKPYLIRTKFGDVVLASKAMTVPKVGAGILMFDEYYINGMATSPLKGSVLEPTHFCEVPNFEDGVVPESTGEEPVQEVAEKVKSEDLKDSHAEYWFCRWYGLIAEDDYWVDCFTGILRVRRKDIDISGKSGVLSGWERYQIDDMCIDLKYIESIICEAQQDPTVTYEIQCDLIDGKMGKYAWEGYIAAVVNKVSGRRTAGRGKSARRALLNAILLDTYGHEIDNGPCISAQRDIDYRGRDKGTYIIDVQEDDSEEDAPRDETA